MNLVVLDRDGVVNHDSDAYIKSPEEWIPIEGSLDAIAKLNRAGCQVVITTNQSGIRRGLFSFETLNAIHTKLQRQLAEVGGHVDAILACPCHPDDGCDCFKPSPGMLVEVSERLRVSMEGIPVIGDTERDLSAARAVGARPILVRTGKGERTLAAMDDHESVEVFDDLSAAAAALIAEIEARSR